jgi:hypothetical protein
MSWKKAAADLTEKGASKEDALQAQIRELKAQLAAALPSTPRLPAASPPAAALRPL